MKMENKKNKREEKKWWPTSLQYSCAFFNFNNLLNGSKATKTSFIIA